MWNPLKVWREEKAADRAVILEAIGVLKTAFEAQTKQAEVLKAFLDSFNVVEPPKIREWDEEASVQRLLESRDMVLPPELQGLSRLEQFEMLLDHMDTE